MPTSDVTSVWRVASLPWSVVTWFATRDASIISKTWGDITAYTRLSLYIAARSASSSANVVSVGTLATRVLMLAASVDRRAWSVKEVLALSEVAPVTSAVRWVRRVTRAASSVSNNCWAATNFALGVVVVVEPADATVAMPSPIVATSANTATDLIVNCFILLSLQKNRPHSTKR